MRLGLLKNPVVCPKNVVADFHTHVGYPLTRSYCICVGGVSVCWLALMPWTLYLAVAETLPRLEINALRLLDFPANRRRDID
jgi:hypothetical protein